MHRSARDFMQKQMVLNGFHPLLRGHYRSIEIPGAYHSISKFYFITLTVNHLNTER